MMRAVDIVMLAAAAGGVYYLLTRAKKPAAPIPLQNPGGGYDPTGGIGFYDMTFTRPVNATTGEWI